MTFDVFTTTGVALLAGAIRPPIKAVEAEKLVRRSLKKRLQFPTRINDFGSRLRPRQSQANSIREEKKRIEDVRRRGNRSSGHRQWIGNVQGQCEIEYSVGFSQPPLSKLSDVVARWYIAQINNVLKLFFIYFSFLHLDHVLLCW